MFLSITVEEFKGLLDKTNFIISSLIIIYTIILFTKVKNYHTFIDKKTYNSYLTLGIVILYAAFLMFVDHLLFILKLEQFQVYFELLLLGSVFITIIIVYKLNEDIKILSVKLSNAASQDEALYKILFLQKLIIQNNLHKRNKVLLQGYILDHELDCKITDCNLGKYKNKVLFKSISHNYSVANNIFNKKKSTNSIVSKFNMKTQSIKSLKSNKSINKSDRRSKNLKRDFLDKLMSNSEKSNLTDSNSGSKSLGSYNYQNENNDSSDCSVETNLKLLNEDEKNNSDGENDLEVDDFQESLLANKQKCFENSSESLQFLFLHIEKEFERYSQKFSDNFYLRFFYCQLLVYEFYNYNKALRILKDLENKCVDLTEEFMVYTLKQRILNFQNELNLYLEMELNQDKNKDEILSNIKFVNLANEYKNKLEKVGEQLIDFWENFKGTSEINKIKFKGYKVCDTISEIFDLYHQLEILNNKNAELQWLHGIFLCDIIDDKTNGKELIQKSKLNLSTFICKTIKFNIDEVLSKGYSTCISVFKDTKGAEIIRCSMQFAKQFGYNSCELEGKNVNYLLPKIFSTYHNIIIHDYNESNTINNSRNNRKIIKGFAIHKSGFIFKIHTNITKIPSFKYDKSYLIRVLHTENLSEYQGYFITDKYLNISYISTEIPLIFGINEKETVLIRNSHMLKTLDRFNLTEFIQEFKITRNDFINLEDSLNLNKNSKNINTAGSNEACFNVESNKFTNEQKINLIIEKKLEEYRAKEQVNETRYHFYVGNFSKKANSYNILIDDLFKFQADRRRTSNNRIKFTSKNLLKDTSEIENHNNFSTYNNHIHKQFQRPSFTNMNNFSLSINNNNFSSKNILMNNMRNVSNKNILQTNNYDDNFKVLNEEKKTINGKLEIVKLYFGQYDTEYLLIKASIDFKMNKIGLRDFKIKHKKNFEFKYDELTHSTILKKNENKEDENTLDEDSSFYTNDNYINNTNRNNNMLNSFKHRQFKRSKTNVNKISILNNEKFNDRNNFESDYFKESSKSPVKERSNLRLNNFDVNINVNANKHDDQVNKKYNKSVSLIEDPTRNKNKELNNKDKIFSHKKPVINNNTTIVSNNIQASSSNNNINNSNYKSTNTNISNNLFTPSVSINDQLNIFNYGNDVTLYKIDLNTFNLTKTYHVSYLNEKKILEITEDTVMINEDNYEDDSDDENNFSNLENAKVEEIKKADVLSQATHKLNYSGLNFVIYFSYLVIIIHCVLVTISFVKYHKTKDDYNLLLETISYVSSSTNHTLSIVDSITNIDLITNDLLKEEVLNIYYSPSESADTSSSSTNQNSAITQYLTKTEYLDYFLEKYQNETLLMYIVNTQLNDYFINNNDLYFLETDEYKKFYFNSTRLVENSDYRENIKPNVVINPILPSNPTQEQVDGIIDNSKYTIFYIPINFLEGTMEVMNSLEDIVLAMKYRNFTFENTYNNDLFFVLSNYLNSNLKNLDDINERCNFLINNHDYKVTQVVMLIVSTVVSVTIIYTTFHFMQTTLLKIYNIYYEILNISSHEIFTITNSFHNFVKLTKNIIDEEDIEDNFEDNKIVKDTKKKNKISKNQIRKSDFTFYRLLVVSIPLGIIMLMHFLSMLLQMENIVTHYSDFAKELINFNAYNKYTFLASTSVKMKVLRYNYFTIEYQDNSNTKEFLKQYISSFEKLSDYLKDTKYNSLIEDYVSSSKKFNYEHFYDLYQKNQTSIITFEYINVEITDKLYNYYDLYSNYIDMFNETYAKELILNNNLTYHLITDRESMMAPIYQIFYNNIISRMNDKEGELTLVLNVIFISFMVITLFLFLFIWLPTEKNIIIENSKIKKLVLLLPTKIIKRKPKILDMLKEEGYVSIISNNVN